MLSPVFAAMELKVETSPAGQLLPPISVGDPKPNAAKSPIFSGRGVPSGFLYRPLGQFCDHPCVTELAPQLSSVAVIAFRRALQVEVAHVAGMVLIHAQQIMRLHVANEI